jgi:DNA-binding response OmpR family regulator
VRRAPPRRPAVTGAAPRGRGERQLLVEDDPALRAATAHHLVSLGYAVETAPDAEAALAAASRTALDLVVADVQLGATTGPELVRRLRERQPVRVLYLSGYTDRIALRGGPGPGEAFFLKKPFSADGLGRMVRELLDGPGPGAPLPAAAPRAEHG